MKTLIVAEHDNLSLNPSNAHVITAATQLSETIDLLIAGTPDNKVLKDAANYKEINCIWTAVCEDYKNQLPENFSLLIAEIGKNYDYVLMPANTFGKNILPRVSGILDISMVADVIKVVDKNTFIRPIYAGNALATININEEIKLLTIRATAFFKTESSDQQNNNIKPHDHNAFVNTLSKFIKCEKTNSSRPELTDAQIVVSGGRGFKSADNFRLLEDFADNIGAAVGATRAAVDAGFAPNDWQVGQTGKIVAPDIYIAIGISGAIQHLAGIKDSKIIIAINNDPNAPIFQIADFCLEGDLFEILPKLQAELSMHKLTL